MKRRGINIRRVALISLMMFLSSTFSIAKSSETLKLVEITGHQKMLSQRIAKDYIYIGANIAVNKARKELATTLTQTIKNQKNLQKSINDPKIINMMMFIGMNYDDIKEKSKEKFSKDNAQYIIDLSESLLEGNDYIMKSLKKLSKEKSSQVKVSKLIDMSEKQSMLSQRIAKYYIAYQIGIKDKNSIHQMKKTVEDFSKIHQFLMKNQTNTPKINVMLKKVDKLWNIVYKFYLDIETGGLPFIVFNTTDDISAKMDEIASLYLEIK
ncbi:Nitric oxide-responding transcriptional regulator Dnr (Crp/Fnr family) [hydrothermal vent metagenome]|uniref:Nitric oxide-responding transcriptional regulator Dnr (Crp/Fnr family) n=1 Tax=hydrothermal vent metagenome TaxID=652676 RepID=A0A1W1EHF8_9ZZZZ